MPSLAVKEIGALGAPLKIHLGSGADCGLDFTEHTDARTWCTWKGQPQVLSDVNCASAGAMLGRQACLGPSVYEKTCFAGLRPVKAWHP